MWQYMGMENNIKTRTETRTETRFVYFLNRDLTIEGCKFAKGESLINGWHGVARPELSLVHCGQLVGMVAVPADAVDVYKRTVTFTEVTEYEAVK
jgi:hypothetical protein